MARPDSEDNQPRHDSSPPRHRHIWATETVGLLLIALVILVITIVRYWHDIHWSLR
jgi:hypothetical protein